MIHFDVKKPGKIMVSAITSPATAKDREQPALPGPRANLTVFGIINRL
jgi:hypothetical protein